MFQDIYLADASFGVVLFSLEAQCKNATYFDPSAALMVTSRREEGVLGMAGGW